MEEKDHVLSKSILNLVFHWLTLLPISTTISTSNLPKKKVRRLGLEVFFSAANRTFYSKKEIVGKTAFFFITYYLVLLLAGSIVWKYFI
ncbi:MAG: hypothetical protein JWN56_1219 [Sphingobacteriales bacterium]|nr:hypothetical protein [Sphingobacteriales bacterium]